MDSVTLIDNSGAFFSALEEQIEVALEAVGQQAETHTKNNLTRAGKRDTGNLVNSIAHEVRMSEDAVYVGSNVEYAPYVEYGTGKYGDNSTGDGWWVYVTGQSSPGGNRVKGRRYTETQARRIVAILRANGLDAHMTQGMRPTHFLKSAVMDHAEEYRRIAETYLSKL